MRAPRDSEITVPFLRGQIMKTPFQKHTQHGFLTLVFSSMILLSLGLQGSLTEFASHQLCLYEMNAKWVGVLRFPLRHPEGPILSCVARYLPKEKIVIQDDIGIENLK